MRILVLMEHVATLSVVVKPVVFLEMYAMLIMSVLLHVLGIFAKMVLVAVLLIVVVIHVVLLALHVILLLSSVWPTAL